MRLSQRLLLNVLAIVVVLVAAVVLIVDMRLRARIVEQTEGELVRDARFVAAEWRSTFSSDDLAAAKWPLARQPHLFETSLPGIFAVGDVRSGNVKRAAAAVGEGSIAVSFVHRVLAE